jgi:hypothetical protein
MTITLTLEVMIESFKDEVSEKGNYTARGVSFVLKAAKGCEMAQMAIFTPSNGNAGQILFLTKDKGLVARVNKAKAARGSDSDEVVRLKAELAELKAIKAELAELKAARDGTAVKKPVSEAARLKAELAALRAGK